MNLLALLQLAAAWLGLPQPYVPPPKIEPVVITEVRYITPATPIPTQPARPAVLDRGGCSLAYIKEHESHGDYRARNGQYTGAYQQSTNSWRTYGDGSAPEAYLASPASQDAAAERQYAAEGSRPWSVCRGRS